MTHPSQREPRARLAALPRQQRDFPLSEALLRELASEFPRFKLVHKQHDAFSKLLDVVLRVLTFGGQRAYLSHYHTVIGNTLYLPAAWDTTNDADRTITLRHERIHLRQRRRYGFLPMAFLYLVPWFPLGLAYGRARLEWEAYTETLRATAEIYGLAEARSPALRQHIVRRFTGPDYGWMWPFRTQVEGWYDRVLETLVPEKNFLAKDS